MLRVLTSSTSIGTASESAEVADASFFFASRLRLEPLLSGGAAGPCFDRRRRPSDPASESESEALCSCSLPSVSDAEDTADSSPDELDELEEEEEEDDEDEAPPRSLRRLLRSCMRARCAAVVGMLCTRPISCGRYGAGLRKACWLSRRAPGSNEEAAAEEDAEDNPAATAAPFMAGTASDALATAERSSTPPATAAAAAAARCAPLSSASLHRASR